MNFFKPLKSFSEKNADNLSFTEHLEVLRNMALRMVLATLLFAILAFIFRDFIFNTLLFSPREEGFVTNRFMCFLAEAWNMPVLCLQTGNFTLINLEVAGQFRAHMYISIIAGVIAAFPYCLAEIWIFIMPALYAGEKRHLKTAIISGIFLFFAGVAFGYFIITPLALNFLINYNVSSEVLNQIQLGNYIRTIGGISLSSGILFQLPLLIYILAKIGLISASFLRKYRRHSYVVVVILSAILTPPDVFSQILVSIPLIFLYEISISIAKNVSSPKIDD